MTVYENGEWIIYAHSLYPKIFNTFHKKCNFGWSGGWRSLKGTCDKCSSIDPLPPDAQHFAKLSLL